MPNLKWNCFLALPLLFLGCATPTQAPLTKAEQIKRDHFLGLKLAEELEQELQIKQDIEVSIYLRKLGLQLTETTEDLRNFPLGVLTVQNKDHRWKNFSLPGNRIYLSIGLIRKLEFENELAATLAIELSHLLKRHLLARLETYHPGLLYHFTASDPLLPKQYSIRPWENHLPTYQDYFGPNGIFTFEEISYLEATDAAIGILYRAGFDPRGLMTLWNQFKANPKFSPLESKTVENLIEMTRQKLTQSAPLRNPIVRSPNFLNLLNRIKTL